MNSKVLIVDDEPLVLEALRRHLDREADVATAVNGAAGLDVIAAHGPFGVVLSDMRMPGMSGAAFLEKVGEVSPDSVRMILTGYADLESTIAAVNSARIYRFLTKPCKSTELVAAVEDGLAQYELVIARRELLEKTLHGTVQMLTEILGLTNPAAQHRANRISRYAAKLCRALDAPMEWQLKIAVMLSQIGCITLPEEILARMQAGQPLSDEARSVYESHPDLAARLLAGIPRLEAVAAIVSRQLDLPNFGSRPGDLRTWDIEEFGAVILRICTDLDELFVTGAPREQALKSLLALHPGLPRDLMRALESMDLSRPKPETAPVKVAQLRVGMILDEDVLASDGMRLLSKGQEVTRSIMLRLQVVANRAGVVQPFRIVLI